MEDTRLPLEGLQFDPSDFPPEVKEKLDKELTLYNEKLNRDLILIQQETILICYLFYKLRYGLIGKGQWDNELEWFLKNSITPTGKRILEGIKAYLQK